MEHAAITVTLPGPQDELLGFFVEGGNSPHLVATYTPKFKAFKYEGLSQAREHLVKLKTSIEQEGYTCGAVIQQPSQAWKELILGRPLTPEEVQLHKDAQENEE